MFPAVGKLMKPKRKRPLSDERRAQLAEAGRATRFQGRSAGVHAPENDLETHRRAQQVLGHP